MIGVHLKVLRDQRLFMLIAIIGFTVLMAPTLLVMVLAFNQKVGGAEQAMTDFAIGMVFPYILLGALIGANCGSIDDRSGTWRELAITGRNRIVICIEQWGAAMVASVAAAASSMMLLMIVATVGADGSAFTGDAVRSGLAAMLVIALTTSLGFGLGQLLGSRGAPVGIIAAFLFVIDSLLLFAPKVSDVWIHVSLGTTVNEIATHLDLTSIEGGTTDTTLAGFVTRYVLWIVIPIAVGITRRVRREL